MEAAEEKAAARWLASLAAAAALRAICALSRSAAKLLPCGMAVALGRATGKSDKGRLDAEGILRDKPASCDWSFDCFPELDNGLVAVRGCATPSGLRSRSWLLNVDCVAEFPLSTGKQLAGGIASIGLGGTDALSPFLLLTALSLLGKLPV